MLLLNSYPITGCKKNVQDKGDEVGHLIEQSHDGKVNVTR
jgi:hypothetical protein